MCIENTNSIHTTIGVTLMFNTRMEKIQNYMNEHRKHNSEKPTMEILDEIQKHMNECQSVFQQLCDTRKSASSHVFQAFQEPTNISVYLKEAEEQKRREKMAEKSGGAPA